MTQEKLEKLYDEILEDMWIIYNAHSQNTPDGIARQKAIIKKINKHPEVLRVQTNKWGNDTIGIYAVNRKLFYVTMRVLQDGEACLLKDMLEKNVYDYIKTSEDFRDRIVNSWQYKRLVKRLEARLAGKEEPEYDDDDLFDEDENADEYDSIME